MVNLAIEESRMLLRNKCCMSERAEVLWVRGQFF